MITAENTVAEPTAARRDMERTRFFLWVKFIAEQNWHREMIKNPAMFDEAEITAQSKAAQIAVAAYNACDFAYNQLRKQDGGID